MQGRVCVAKNQLHPSLPSIPHLPISQRLSHPPSNFSHPQPSHLLLDPPQDHIHSHRTTRTILLSPPSLQPSPPILPSPHPQPHPSLPPSSHHPSLPPLSSSPSPPHQSPITHQNTQSYQVRKSMTGLDSRVRVYKTGKRACYGAGHW